MPLKKLLTNEKAYITFAALLDLTEHYENRHSIDVLPCRKRALITLMFHKYAIHVLVNGKLTESVSINHLREIIK